MDRYQAELDADVDFVRERLGSQNGSGWLARQEAAEAILAEATDAEFVVLGSKVHSKLGAALLGSVTTAVTAKASCPVVVVRADRLLHTSSWRCRPGDRVVQPRHGLPP